MNASSPNSSFRENRSAEKKTWIPRERNSRLAGDSIKLPHLSRFSGEMSRAIMSRCVSFRGWRHISSRYVIVVIESMAVSILYLIFTASPAGTFLLRQSVAVSSKWTGNGCELIKGIFFKLIKRIYMFAFPE